MNNLCIDIGNTRVKLAVLNDAHEVLALVIKKTLKTKKIKELIQTHRVENAIISSVRQKGNGLLRWLRKRLHTVIRLTPSTLLPIRNDYATPTTLGKDRLAGAVGAWALFPQGDSLVIDAGTCIKYDFVHHTGAYKGGSISMGLQMRFRALEHFTARLPLVNPLPLTHITGDTTQTAIATGVQYGMHYEIQGFIQAYQHLYGHNLQVILTGGDTSFFETTLENRIFAQPNLVLIGLNQILKYNVQINAR